MKVKIHMDLYSACRCRDNTFKALRYGMRSQGISQFTCTPNVHLLMERTVPAFAFPAEAGTHLPTPEGWKDGINYNIVKTENMAFNSNNSKIHSQCI